MFRPGIRARIAARAQDQHGLIAHRQLRELGLSAKQIRGSLASGHLEVELPLVYRIAGSPPTAEQRVAAAVLWGGSTANASFRSAATLWEIDVPEGVRPEISVLDTTNPRCADVIVHRVSVPPTRRLRLGIPVTSPERTIIDLAGVLTAPQLEIAFESARRARLVTVESASRELVRAGAKGRRGTARLGALLTTLAEQPAAESALEVLVARLLRDSDLPAPQRQVEVVVDGRRYRLDFAWPELLVALECDGRAWHEFERDRRRWSRITAATGYRMVWATWARVHEEPERIIEEIRQLASRHCAG
jgi:very-short-patch-repair endonuclease